MTSPQPRGRGRVWRWALWTALMVTASPSSKWATHTADAATVMGLCVRQPKVRVDCYPPVENFPNATEEGCLAQGCCWNPLHNDGISCAFDALGRPEEAHCEKVSNTSRVACRNPRFAVNDLVQDIDTCHESGCCFDADQGTCFQPFYEGYELLTLEETSSGWRGTLVLRRFKRGPFGNDVPLLQLHVIKETATRVRIRITDPSFPRYEVGLHNDHGEKGDDEEKQRDTDHRSKYHVHFYERPFGLAVTRRDNGEVLFNSTPNIHASTSFNGLVFENQFLEISTHLERHSAVNSPVLYGLGGGRYGHTRLRADDKGDQYPLFSHKTSSEAGGGGGAEGGGNSGGVHPFYLQVLESSNSHGVFFRSSNAMEVVTQENALTFRTTGGVIDFYVFTGPTALDVVSQYTAVVGRPELPPVWALGYHYGKRGGDHHHQSSLNESMADVAKLRLAGVPFDSYWPSGAYMYDSEAFTLDTTKFPLQDTQAFIHDLHFHNQHVVLLLTPTVATSPQSSKKSDVIVVDSGYDELDCDDESNDTTTMTSLTAQAAAYEDFHYYPLRRGAEMDVFVKGIVGERYAEKRIGSKWSVFVDFFHPNATKYWHEMVHNFHDQVLPFDGVWMDSDASSSFCDRAFADASHTCGGPHGDELLVSEDGESVEDEEESVSFASVGHHVIQKASLQAFVVGDGAFVRSLDVAFPFDPYRQPFVPGQSNSEVTGGERGNLNVATLPMAALHHKSLHYNLHSLYSHAQARATRVALDRVLKRRSLSLSKSTYAGDGQFTGQLLNDVDATWGNLQRSIAGVVAMNLVGMPLSAQSIGGNGIGMDEELSIRWHQASSFFPLMYNLASHDATRQSPVDFDQETANIIRETLLTRYKHLPYLYTQLYHAHAHGYPVVRGLALEFPEDPHAYDVETQYLVGSALMVSPVVENHAISTRVYFPNATWYDLDSGRLLMETAVAQEEEDTTGGQARFALVLAPLTTLPVHIRGGYIVPTQQPSVTTAITKRGVYRLVVALDSSHNSEPSARGELFVDDGDSLGSVQELRYSLVNFHAKLTKDGTTLELSSKRLFHGYDGPEMHVDVEEIVVFGVKGAFFANSSLHLHGESSHHKAKVDYFEQASMLVLSQLKVPIGEELQLHVEARNEVPPPAEEGEGETEEEGGEEEEGEEEGGGEGEGEGAAEAHGGQKPSKEEEEESEQGEKEESGEGERPAPVTGEQKGRKKKGITTIGIIGIVAGVIFVAAIFIVVLQRRRRGYNPIT